MARQSWATRNMFIFAAIGSAVGLGNLWRFPYLTYEYGGGAFLIPYFLALIIIGIPFIILEFAIGQKFQKGAVHSFEKIHKKLKGVGFAAVLAAFFIMTYYSAVMAWCMIYLSKSFSSTLPWAGNSEGYFFSDVLQISSGIGEIGAVVWPLFIALSLVWGITYFIIRKGTESVGKVVMYTVPLPLILLLILLIRAVTLPGAMSGIGAYLIPDFSALLDIKIWTAAATQIFFSLSLAFGTMIAYSSFNRKNDIRSDGITTAISNSAISIFAGFVVFSVLGFMANASGVSVADVATSGVGLAFVVFPEALALMPWAPFFSVLFFLALLSLGIDSLFSIIESITASLRDKFPRVSTDKIAFWTCLVGFSLGIIYITQAGLYYLDLVDHFVVNVLLFVIAIFECLAVGWVFGADKMRAYINSTSKVQLGVWWEYAIKFVLPILLTVFLILQFLEEIGTNYGGYSDTAIAIGWMFVIVPVIAIIVYSLIPDEQRE